MKKTNAALLILLLLTLPLCGCMETTQHNMKDWLHDKAYDKGRSAGDF